LKPILVLQHSPDVEPGYFGDYLTAKGFAWEWVRIDQGDKVPDSMEPYAGLGLMGGAMSVNDSLPWIPLVCELIVQSDVLGRPVIGHCLGGQLMAKALGAQVRSHDRKELGWGSLSVSHPRLGLEWLGVESGNIPSFQWHGDTFDLPEDAVLLLTNSFCSNQAFVIERAGQVAHLGMQCHMEMTPDLITRWAVKGAAEIQVAYLADSSCVQTQTEMLKNNSVQCENLHKFTSRLYDRWMLGVLESSAGL
jgi:GMP synthase-like glutamine amidotransferase